MAAWGAHAHETDPRARRGRAGASTRCDRGLGGAARMRKSAVGLFTGRHFGLHFGDPFRAVVLSRPPRRPVRLVLLGLTVLVRGPLPASTCGLPGTSLVEGKSVAVV